jgi:hypothetical protein
LRKNWIHRVIETYNRKGQAIASMEMPFRLKLEKIKLSNFIIPAAEPGVPLVQPGDTARVRALVETLTKFSCRLNNFS